MEIRVENWSNLRTFWKGVFLLLSHLQSESFCADHKKDANISNENSQWKFEFY